MYWCLGMFGSGSTWVFNVALKLAAVLHPGRRPEGRYVTGPRDLAFIDDSALFPVVKVHTVEEAAVPELSRRAEIILISIRDPRDCVTSLMQYQRLDFEKALAWAAGSARYCARFAAHPRAMLLRYESGFIDDAATLDAIAARCGAALAPADRDRIFAETRRPAIEAHIARIETLTSVWRGSAGDIADNATQWHRHHAGRTGEIGRWRRLLTPPQIATIERVLGEWMATHGYPSEMTPASSPKAH